MQEVIGTREATKRETRRALLEAAIAEFAERGFDAPSLDAICARAGFTRGAFYVHFSNRDELVSAAMEHAIGTFVQRIMPEGEANDDLSVAVEAFADDVVPELLLSPGALRVGSEGADAIEGPPFHKFLEACARSEAVRDGMRQALGRVIEQLQKAGEAGQGQGYMRDDVGAHEIAGLLLLMALGVFSASEIGLQLDVAALRDTALKLIRRG